MNTANELSTHDDFSNLVNQQKPKLQDTSKIREMPGERSKFNTHFSELLNPEDPNGKLILAFARHCLRQFRLNGLHSERSVLIEAYVRGVQRIQNGVVIQNPSAWLRGAVYLIVKELHREQRKTETLEDRILESQIQVQSTSTIDKEVDDDLNLRKLRTAFRSLTPSDQQLLNLRIVKECSWPSIREALMLQNGVDYQESTLRKRKERALKRLRNAYCAQAEEAMKADG